MSARGLVPSRVDPRPWPYLGFVPLRGSPACFCASDPDPDGPRRRVPHDHAAAGQRARDETAGPASGRRESGALRLGVEGGRGPSGTSGARSRKGGARRRITRTGSGQSDGRFIHVLEFEAHASAELHPALRLLLVPHGHQGGGLLLCLLVGVRRNLRAGPGRERRRRQRGHRPVGGSEELARRWLHDPTRQSGLQRRTAVLPLALGAVGAVRRGSLGAVVLKPWAVRVTSDRPPRAARR